MESEHDKVEIISKQISALAIPLFHAPSCDMVTECSTAVGSILGYKDVLRCVFDSEECKYRYSEGEKFEKSSGGALHDSK